MTIDVLFVNPGGIKKRVYQELSKEYSAVEPPFWAALTAGFIRHFDYKVDILDANAENLTVEETALAINDRQPKLVNIVVYGQQPAASTQLMDSVDCLCKMTIPPTVLTGLHPTALSIMTMYHTETDYIAIGEGFYTILGLVQDLKKSKIPGLVYREGNNGGNIVSTGRAGNIDLPKYFVDVAWDLLPMDKYRAHNHQCLGEFEKRPYYASISTSLGCPFKCKFCSIHCTFAEHKIRYWNPEWVLKQIDILVKKYHVKVLKIIDELFIFNHKHYLPICEGLIERDYGLNIWSYARVDTIDVKNLLPLHNAGFKWLCLGIEAADSVVMNDVSKRLPVNTAEVVEKIRNAGINILGNFMFGLPEDNFITMAATLELAKSLQCEFVNFYSTFPYPGSELYNETKPEDLPNSWLGYSQHSYECKPLPTKYLSASEVLAFRDFAFNVYFRNQKYLDMVEKKFGKEAREHIEKMVKVRLKRKILGD